MKPTILLQRVEPTLATVEVTNPRLATVFPLESLVVQYQQQSGTWTSRWKSASPSEHQGRAYTITGLRPNTRYRIRAAAKYVQEKRYATQETFETPPGTVENVDAGNTYASVLDRYVAISFMSMFM